MLLEKNLKLPASQKANSMSNESEKKTFFDNISQQKKETREEKIDSNDKKSSNSNTVIAGMRILLNASSFKAGFVQ